MKPVFHTSQMYFKVIINVIINPKIRNTGSHVLMCFFSSFLIARKCLDLERKGSDLLKSQIFLKFFSYIYIKKILLGNQTFQKLFFCKVFQNKSIISSIIYIFIFKIPHKSIFICCKTYKQDCNFLGGIC